MKYIGPCLKLRKGKNYLIKEIFWKYSCYTMELRNKGFYKRMKRLEDLHSEELPIRRGTKCRDWVLGYILRREPVPGCGAPGNNPRKLICQLKKFHSKTKNQHKLAKETETRLSILSDLVLTACRKLCCRQLLEKTCRTETSRPAEDMH